MSVDPDNALYQPDRFQLVRYADDDQAWLIDNLTLDKHLLDLNNLMDSEFDIVHWLHLRKSEVYDQLVFDQQDPHDDSDPVDDLPELIDCEDDLAGTFAMPMLSVTTPLLGICARMYNTFGMLWCGSFKPQTTECTAGQVKGRDSDWVIPKLTIVSVQLNGQPCQALLDSGSLSDFVSTTLVDQLRLRMDVLKSLLNLQPAVSGSHSKVKATVTARVDYQDIHGDRTFDVINLDSYDMILGTPFLYQHQVLLGFNPAQVTVRSNVSLPIRGAQAIMIESWATEALKDWVDSYRAELWDYAKDICKDTVETPLPPLRAINHVIPLITDNCVYAWRPSKCPKPLRPLWWGKRDDYLKTGCWQFHSGTNAVPMLMLKKPSKDGTL